MQKLLTFFFSKNISIYAIFNDQSFNDTLTNDIVSFEQLDPRYVLWALYNNFKGMDAFARFFHHFLQGRQLLLLSI